MAPRIFYKFVKTADAALLSQIISLYKNQGWWEPQDGSRLLARLIKGSHCFIIACAGKNPVGMGRAISDKASDAYIQDVFVLARHRGKGIGAAIISRLKARLEKDGIKWIGLIAQDNSGKFYEPLGFKVITRSQPMMLKRNHV